MTNNVEFEWKWLFWSRGERLLVPTDMHSPGNTT